MKYIHCLGLNTTDALAAAEYVREDKLKEDRKEGPGDNGTLMSIVEAFEKFVQEDLRPYIDKASMCVLIQKAYAQPEVGRTDFCSLESNFLSCVEISD